MQNRTAISQKKANLLFAEAEAKKHGHRWTETRAQVYEALLDAAKPVTAYQLVDDVAKRYARSVKPMSIYRSLDALITLGLVAKIGSVNAFTACQHPQHAHQHVFLVCDHCGNIDEIADHGISSQLIKDAARKGFRAARQTLELHGDCSTCQ